MSFDIETWLRSKFRHKDIGWKEIDEKFVRYAIFKCKRFNVYLHQLSAPKWHPECHDHPWSFLTIILWRGYVEMIQGKKDLKLKRRRPGMILWRHHSFTHNVITPFGTAWSLIFTGPKSNEWGFKECK